MRHRFSGRHSVSLAAFRNDIDDLTRELHEPLLASYLQELQFTQNLKARAQEVDAALRGWLVMYTAALFSGDVYYKKKEYGSAGEWFARAIQMDPDRETAYRFADY